MQYALNRTCSFTVLCRNKRKIHLKNCHGGPDKEQMLSCTISLTSVLDGDGMFNAKSLRLYLQEYPVFITKELRWAPRAVWWRAENLSLTGIRTPARPERSQKL